MPLSLCGWVYVRDCGNNDKKNDPENIELLWVCCRSRLTSRNCQDSPNQNRNSTPKMIQRNRNAIQQRANNDIQLSASLYSSTYASFPPPPVCGCMAWFVGRVRTENKIPTFFLRVGVCMRGSEWVNGDTKYGARDLQIHIEKWQISCMINKKWQWWMIHKKMVSSLCSTYDIQYTWNALTQFGGATIHAADHEYMYHNDARVFRHA